jgi:hypothetical protein
MANDGGSQDGWISRSWRMVEFGWVYFVEAPELRRIKIGYTGGHPKDRLADLRMVHRPPLGRTGALMPMPSRSFRLRPTNEPHPLRQFPRPVHGAHPRRSPRQDIAPAVHPVLRAAPRRVLGLLPPVRAHSAPDPAIPGTFVLLVYSAAPDRFVVFRGAREEGGEAPIGAGKADAEAKDEP